MYRGISEAIINIALTPAGDIVVLLMVAYPLLLADHIKTQKK